MGKGAITVKKNGKRNISPKGNLDISSNNPHGSCCCCKPYTLASCSTSSDSWDLSPYQGDGIAEPKRYWRLTNNYTGYVPIRRGCVDKNGKLVGLPGSISPDSYKYTWTFSLEIGCLDTTGNSVQFPTGTESTSYYNCKES